MILKKWGRRLRNVTLTSDALDFGENGGHLSSADIWLVKTVRYFADNKNTNDMSITHTRRIVSPIVYSYKLLLLITVASTMMLLFP